MGRSLKILLLVARLKALQLSSEILMKRYLKVQQIFLEKSVNYQLVYHKLVFLLKKWVKAKDRQGGIIQ